MTDIITKAVMLCHPSSKDLCPKSAFRSKLVKLTRIACGTTKPKNADLYESNDFFPTYASLNSGLFETSVILTVWEHADEIIGRNHIAFIHSDIIPNYKATDIWSNINSIINEKEKTAIGLAMPVHLQGIIDEFTITDTKRFNAINDPMNIHSFDNEILVWDYIKKYDRDIYEYAFDINPVMIYSHQFACSRALFDILGNSLCSIVNKLRLSDIGLWTPHMFERLIALYLSKYGSRIILTSAFWHYCSSSLRGPGELNLYGPRPFKYYRIATRWNQGTVACTNATNAASTASKNSGSKSSNDSMP